MKENLYITTMFPYPSSSGLHCGHWYTQSIGRVNRTKTKAEIRKEKIKNILK